MAKFLITGARSPAALELARNISRDGHTVYMADSLWFPLARCSKFVKKTFRISSPRVSLSKFKNDLDNIISEYSIDLLIPTCEEVFYISAIKSSLEINTKVFCPELSLMKRLHSKYNVYCAANNTSFSDPNTEVLSGQALLARKVYKGKVVKKEFCRFGTGVLIGPGFKDVSRLVGQQFNDRFVMQDKVEGVEYCTYAIAHNGNVVSESIYMPQHRVRMAAGIYFKPIINEKISKAIKGFCEKNNITGQIGFDVIVNGDKVFLLECNPRATSGLHLLSNNTLSQAFLGDEYYSEREHKLSEPKMIKLAMLLIGLPIALRNNHFKQWQHDYRIASDVISVKNDRSLLLFSLLALLEISVISLKTFTSLRSASTFDIEWDGEKLDEY